MSNLQLRIKKETEEDRSEDQTAFAYDQIPVWDFLLNRLRMLVIENRDLITVTLILVLSFGVIWTVRVSNQPVSVKTQAADKAGAIISVVPSPAVTVIVVTPTKTPIPTALLPTPTVFLAPSPFPTVALASPASAQAPDTAPSARPTNPYAQYLR